MKTAIVLFYFLALGLMPASASPEKPKEHSYQIQDWPNDDARDIILDDVEVSESLIDSANLRTDKEYPLIKRLLSVPGVTSVFLKKKAITITKNHEIKSWKELTESVVRAIEAELGIKFRFLSALPRITKWQDVQ